MKMSAIGELPLFFDRYINLVDDISLLEGLEKHSPSDIFGDINFLKSIGTKTYAENKWTISEIIQHCIDTERIMQYRALCFARNESTSLPGFEENEYAKYSDAKDRNLEELFEEFAQLRKSTILLFKSMNSGMLLNKGKANNSEISPLSIGFVIIGHPIHHANIIKEKYLTI